MDDEKMPRLRTKTDRPSEHPEAGQEHVVRLQVDAMDNEEVVAVVVDNQVNNLNPNTTTQPQQRPPQQRPRQLKLPNFLSSPIDNLAHYLGSVPTGLVGPRSGSVDRKTETVRNEGGSWSRTRVQSLDRESKEEAPILSFVAPRSPRSMNMVGVVCQVADPYQEEGAADPDEAAAGAAQNGETEEVDDDSVPSKDADCLIG